MLIANLLGRFPLRQSRQAFSRADDSARAMTGNALAGGNAAAWIDGRPASLDDGVAAAARRLSTAGNPVISGLGADVAATREAVLLAARFGGVLDHVHAAAILRDLDLMRETGAMLTTPTEARVRADLVLLVGDGIEAAWPESAPACSRRLSGEAPPAPAAGSSG